AYESSHPRISLRVTFLSVCVPAITSLVLIAFGLSASRAFRRRSRPRKSWAKTGMNEQFYGVGAGESRAAGARCIAIIFIFDAAVQLQPWSARVEIEALDPVTGLMHGAAIRRRAW